VKLFLTTLLFLMVFRHADAKVCPGSTPARSDDGPYSSYTVPNLIAHSIERIVDDQGSVTEILLLNPKIFGLDAENAILTASLHVIVDDVVDLPQI
jgi:hypothetical protein